MISKTFIIQNSEGLHMRPAGFVVMEMGKFSSNVSILFGEKKINAKSLIDIISAGIKMGSEVTFVCDGDDEEEALTKVEELVNQNFGD